MMRPFPPRPAVPGSRRRAQLIPLLVPVPPNLAEVLGYQGDGRYLQLVFGAAGNSLRIADGAVVMDCANWGGWLAYYKHPAVHPVLHPLQCWPSAGAPRRVLLLDREAARLYATTPAAAAALLAAAPATVPPPSDDADEADIDALADCVVAQHHQYKRLTGDMLAWLAAR